MWLHHGDMTDAETLFNLDDLALFKVSAEETDPSSRVPEAGKTEKYLRLSKILKGIPASETFLILKEWDAAIMAGTIRAVPYKGHTFRKTIIDEAGQERTAELQDELVEMTPAFETWLAQQREEARYAVMPYHGEIATTPDRLKRNEDDFERLVQARVQRLQGNQPGRKSGRKQA